MRARGKRGDAGCQSRIIRGAPRGRRGRLAKLCRASLRAGPGRRHIARGRVPPLSGAGLPVPDPVRPRLRARRLQGGHAGRNPRGVGRPQGPRRGRDGPAPRLLRGLGAGRGRARHGGGRRRHPRLHGLRAGARARRRPARPAHGARALRHRLRRDRRPPRGRSRHPHGRQFLRPLDRDVCRRGLSGVHASRDRGSRTRSQRVAAVLRDSPGFPPPSVPRRGSKPGSGRRGWTPPGPEAAVLRVAERPVRGPRSRDAPPNRGAASGRACCRRHCR